MVLGFSLPYSPGSPLATLHPTLSTRFIHLLNLALAKRRVAHKQCAHPARALQKFFVLSGAVQTGVSVLYDAQKIQPIFCGSHEMASIWMKRAIRENIMSVERREMAPRGHVPKF